MGVFNLKKISSLILCLLLCGCSATYEVEINEESVIENGVLLQDKETLDNNIINNGMTLSQEIDLTFDSMHDIDNSQEDVKTRSFELEKINTNSELGLKYKKISKIDDYINSPVLRQCYDDIKIINEDNYLSIYTIGKFKCYKYYKHLKNVKIVLTTPYFLENSNYDEKKDDKYYWYITRDNASNKSIKMTLLKNAEVSTKLTELKKEENWNYISYIFVVIGVAGVIVGVRIYLKIKNSNK